MKFFFLTTVSLIIIIFIISFYHFLSWSNDYGFYFVGSNFLDGNYQLYKDHNESKGPSYLFFLNIIISLFGFGNLQAFLGIYFTLLLYIFSIFFISSKILDKHYKIVTILVISVASLNFHDGNSSISFFQGTFLILTFYFIDKYYNSKNLLSLILASFFITVSFLTRVEVLTFVPIIFLSIFFSNKNNFYTIFKHTSISIIIIVILFNFFSNLYSYNFFDFWYNNITINKTVVAYEWKNVASKLFILQYRSELGLYLLSTGIIYFFLYFIINLKKTFKILKKELFSIMFVLIGMCTSIYTESPALKHSLIVIVPLIFLIIKFFLIDYSNFKIFNIIGIIFVVVMSYPELKKVSKNLVNIKCLNNMLCDASRLTNDKIFLEDVKTNDKSIILGGVPWFYMFLNKQPKEGLITGRIYHEKNVNFLKSKYLIKKHNEYLTHDNLEFYLPNNIIKNPNFYTEELIKKSILLKKYANYSKFKINEN